MRLVHGSGIFDSERLPDGVIRRAPFTSSRQLTRTYQFHYQERGFMTLQLGDIAPDFEAETTEGRLRFHEWIGDSWAVLFSHPRNFTPVCTTELGYMARIKPEFDRRNTKIIGLSVDPVENHPAWAEDIEQTQGQAPNYPLIGEAHPNGQPDGA